MTDRASMFTDRLVPLVDALVRYCVEDANVRVCNYTP